MNGFACPICKAYLTKSGLRMFGFCPAGQTFAARAAVSKLPRLQLEQRQSETKNKPPRHEQNQSMCPMQGSRIRDVSRSTQTRKDVGFSVQAVCGGRESGQPLLPIRGDVERVAARGVL